MIVFHSLVSETNPLRPDAGRAGMDRFTAEHEIRPGMLGRLAEASSRRADLSPGCRSAPRAYRGCTPHKCDRGLHERGARPDHPAAAGDAAILQSRACGASMPPDVIRDG